MRGCQEVVFKLFAQSVVVRFDPFAGLLFVEDAIDPTIITLEISTSQVLNSTNQTVRRRHPFKRVEELCYYTGVRAMLASGVIHHTYPGAGRGSQQLQMLEVFPSSIL